MHRLIRKSNRFAIPLSALHFETVIVLIQMRSLILGTPPFPILPSLPRQPQDYIYANYLPYPQTQTLSKLHCLNSSKQFSCCKSKTREL